ncbi:hypothetical protein EJ08DRAFT_607553 [Tothia fuscella]|uniref:Uncharacterized protein n=1 Tax=Tothia fuscella TaxID=1048955 RepID=A0A9P4NVZ3_9PEZI|nr:hypothetical protein EJ08DRAFT_607553 [Tothia fuscella]
MAIVELHGEFSIVPEKSKSKSSKLTPHDLLSHLLSPPANEGLEPPRKKQRVNEGGAFPATAVNDENSVVLACMEMRLRTPLVKKIAKQNLHSPPSPIGILQVKIGNSFQLDLRNLSSLATKVIAIVNFDNLNEFSKENHELLNRIVDLRPSSTSGSQDAPLVWSRCTLEVENGALLIRARLLWSVERSSLDFKHVSYYTTLLDAYIPQDRGASTTSWSPQDFYENVHVPSTDLEVSSHVQNSRLESVLYPFQQRAVDWLLKREGAVFDQSGVVTTPSIQPLALELPPTFYRMQDAHGEECFISYARGVIVKNPSALPNYNSDLRGGILAEEMGLGKTVEIIALIALHRRSKSSLNPSQDGLAMSDATLIITPNHILAQWKNEIESHAPHLSVFHYQGLSAKETKKTKGTNTVEHLLKYDIVLTTYNVLAKEIHYAQTPSDRSLRRTQNRQTEEHVHPRSPLVLINWWRVCLDEAQMIESGVSQAAKVARLIPRLNAWAVSGTPIRKNVDDLLGLLIFLQYEPYCSSKKLWSRVGKLASSQIFGQIALRHTKHKVAHELRLPQQKRMVITMPFTAVEEENYHDLFSQMCEAVGLNLDGAPLAQDWTPNSAHVIEQMRTWLRRLRETCLHPNVGARNRRALGRRQKKGPLRTVGEVLEVMIEGNETELRAEERKLVWANINRAHIIANDKSNFERSKEALVIYQVALEKAKTFVVDCRRELAAEKARAAVDDQELGTASPTEDSADETDAHEKVEEKGGRVASLQRHLRSALEVLHVCNFFVGTSYFQIKGNEELTMRDSPESLLLEELETKHYEEAKLIRQEMLQESRTKATAVMRTISSKQNAKGKGSKKGFSKLPFSQMADVPVLDDLGGIENRKLLDRLDEVSRLLDTQAAQAWEWRAKIVDFLLKPLVDEDLDGQEKTGDEYEDSTKLQDDLFVYVLAFRASAADRHRLIMGQENLLIENEVKGALIQATKGLGTGPPETRNYGHAPALMKEVLNIRNKIKTKKEVTSLRGVISELRSLHAQLQWQGDGGSSRAQIEVSIVERQLHDTQAIMLNQTQILETLEKEQELFRKAMNERVEYYRQLQAISDQVAPYREELNDELDAGALADATKREDTYANKLATLRTKRRFLLHLRAESTSQTQGRICVICTDEFENGVLTVCGHQYCKECIGAWWRAHRSCPECRRQLSLVDFHDITYKPQNIRAQEESTMTGSPSKSAQSSGVGSPGSSTASIYSDISSSTMDEIKCIDLNGSSYGTKIDTIARHLLFLRKNDPGAKSIIFSQYSDYLMVLSDALCHFKIGHVSIRTAGGIEKFRADPAMECLLLDAKSDSSGLNLVNASHIFLCEPLLNPSIELQAIARVHRIGQFRDTMVYMYLIEDTVEEAIYDISVARRLAHLSTTSTLATASGRATPMVDSIKESVLDHANSLELQQKPVGTLLDKGKSAGEIVERDDLWNCLFRNARRRRGNVAGEALSREVGRHLRAEAAEERLMTDAEA